MKCKIEKPKQTIYDWISTVFALLSAPALILAPANLYNKHLQMPALMI